MNKLFANSGDPDQTPHSASDLGAMFFNYIYLQQWVKLKTSSPTVI